MPLKKGTSNQAVSQNISELHQGTTYKKTKRKYGKEKADEQAVAIALNQKRKSKRRKVKYN